MSTEPYDPRDDDTTAGDRDHPSNRGGGWLTPNVRTLSGVSFLQDAASELLYPVLPIFLTTTLGAPVAAVGIIEGAAEGVAAATKLVAGRLGDTRARRPLITLGYGLAAVGKVLSALAVLWPVVLAGRAVDRVGKGIRGAPRDALLTVDADPTARGRIFGFHRAADTAGAVVGPALGLGLYELLNHQIRPLLAIAVIPAILSVLLIRAVHEDSRRDAARAYTPGPGGPRSPGRRLCRPGCARLSPPSGCSGWSTSPTPYCCCGPASSGSPSPG